MYLSFYSVCDNLICLSNIYTSLQQASEWGMHELQGSFPRCKKRLPLDKGISGNGVGMYYFYTQFLH